MSDQFPTSPEPGRREDQWSPSQDSPSPTSPSDAAAPADPTPAQAQGHPQSQETVQLPTAQSDQTTPMPASQPADPRYRTPDAELPAASAVPPAPASAQAGTPPTPGVPGTQQGDPWAPAQASQPASDSTYRSTSGETWSSAPTRAASTDPWNPAATQTAATQAPGSQAYAQQGSAGAPFPHATAPGTPRPVPGTTAAAGQADPWRDASSSMGGGGTGVPGGPGVTLAGDPTPGAGQPPKKTGPGWLALVGAMAATAALTVGGLWAGGVFDDADTAAQGTSSTQTAEPEETVPPVAQSGTAPDWEAVAAAVRPATVSISAVGQTSSGVGSGVIYDHDGHIVTNYHVISTALNGGQLTVTLADGRLFEATIVGTDQSTDLAVIVLTDPPSDLTVATFGASSEVAVGEDVMAIGSPLGLQDTVTTGIVSALNRPVQIQQEEEVDPNDPFSQLPGLRGQTQAQSETVTTNAIQVDASINPGNSGGPLFDATGAVIGLNSSIASMSSSDSSAGSIGLGFAIPSDLVKSVTDQLIATGTVDHAQLGVTIRSATVSVDGSTLIGAEIASVNQGSGAEAAGLKEGDVILSVDGNTVSSDQSLIGYIRRYTGGDEVTLTIVRDGQKQDMQVTLQSQTE